MSLRFISSLMVAVALFGSGPASAQDGTSNTIFFQTRVQTPEGQPIPDGTYPVRFSLYENEAGGTTLWSETQTSVAIADGLSNTVIFGENPPANDLFSQWESLWLEVSIDRDNDGFEPEEAFSPRSPLHAVAFALYAKDAARLGGTAAADYATDAEVQAAVGALENTVGEAQTTQDNAIAMKADAATVQTQQDAQDAAIASKADAVTVQLQQDQQDAAIAGKADASAVFTWEVAEPGVVQVQPNRGYMATLAQSEVFFYLPENAALEPGDIIRVSGAGAGGWRVAQAAGQQIMAQNISRPAFGNTPEASENSRLWHVVACSGDGNTLLAGDGGGPGPMVRSTDGGTTWTSALGNAFWEAAAISADGTDMIVGAAGPGLLYVSDDGGINWYDKISSAAWSGVAISDDGQYMSACANFGGQLYTSNDSGSTWAARESARDWTGIAMSANGAVQVACVNSGYLYVSTDYGVTWTQRGLQQQYRGVACSADGTTMAAVPYNAQIRISYDAGLNWIPVATSQQWFDIDISTDKTTLVAAAYNGQLHVSTNRGLAWRPIESNRAWQSVALRPDGYKIFAVGENTRVLSLGVEPAVIGSNTVVGTNGGLAGRQYAAVELQYVGDGVFMPISSSGSIEAY